MRPGVLRCAQSQYAPIFSLEAQDAVCPSISSYLDAKETECEKGSEYYARKPAQFGYRGHSHSALTECLCFDRAHVVLHSVMLVRISQVVGGVMLILLISQS